MNPLVREMLASIIRHFLTIGAGFLVARGIWTPEDAATYVAAVTLALVSVAWGLYQKYMSRSKLTTALALSYPATEAAVERMVKDADTPTPPPTVPKHVTPRLESGQ